MTRSKGILAPRFRWTPGATEYLRCHFADKPSAEVAAAIGCRITALRAKAAQLGLKKSAAFMASEASGRMVPGTQKGATSRFTKGNVPWSKGKKGLYIAGSEKSWFKKGHTPHNTLYDGAVRERKDKGGRVYQFIRIAMGRWVHLHVHVWEQQHGPVPQGGCIVFKDGNTRNCELANLELITREQLMEKNTIHRYPDQLKQAIRLMKKLQRKINEKQD